jgi:hypothetical protein
MEDLRRVEAILRDWNPIGFPVPPDEYDSYAPPIVTLVAGGASIDDVRAHLHELRTDTIGVGADPDADALTAREIVDALGSGTE